MTNLTPGSFDYFCSQVTLPICPLVGPSSGIEPKCYSRNIELGNSLIFQPATLVILLIALIMTFIMILNIKSKYTAVGRKEILFFFYLYSATILTEFLVLSGIIATATNLYPYFAAAYVSFTLTTLYALLFNGFVGFQWIEDGTPLSLWSLRISSLFIFIIFYFISISTFQDLFGFSSSKPTVLWIIYYGFGTVCILFYLILQLILVFNTIEDKWPLIDLAFATFFFILGQVIEYLLSLLICDLAKHYVDGMFFGTICSLLAVMMVYKYWDDVTKEDLEFSVGGKVNVWEVRDPLLSDDGMSQLKDGSRI